MFRPRVLFRKSEPTLTEPMSSLKVRITFVPSVEVLGALGPVVTRVGRMPSTLCPD